MIRHTCFLLLALSLTACAITSPTTDGSTDILSTSGYVVSPPFTQFYASHGGVRVLGLPISGEVPENGGTVQYFQNVKLEYHSQLPPDSQVILAGLGQAYYGQAPCVPAGSAADTLYFNNCHSVDPAFRGIFEGQGGVAFFGYPISERYIFRSVLMAQNFERATIVWDSNKPVEYQFGLLPLGVALCPDSVCAADPGRAIYVVPPASTPTAPAAADPITRFYIDHGGRRVFGRPVGSPRIADDGRREQVYDNAVLVEDPSAPEGVSLRPLGLKLLVTAQVPAFPLNGPHTGYFAGYGHNVVYNVFDFYTAHGGEAVFGQPITELQSAGGHFVQYFENVAFTIHFNLPPDQIVQLAPLGRLDPLAAVATARANPPQLLVVTTQPLHNVFDPATADQTVTARVLDENGLPVPGAQVRFVIHTPDGAMEFTGATDANGYASYAFALTSFKSGDFMLYDAVADYGSLTNTVSASFVTWGSLAP